MKLKEKIQELFSAPRFEDNERTRTARYLNALLYVIIAVSILLIIARFWNGEPVFSLLNILLVFFIVLSISLQVVMRKGSVRFASLTLTLLTWSGLAFITWANNGLRGSGIFALLSVVLIAGLLLGTRAIFWYTLSTLAFVWFLVNLENSGALQVSVANSNNMAAELTVLLLLIASTLMLTINGLKTAVTTAETSTKDLQERNQDLQSFQAEMENIITARTNELRIATEQDTQRARHLQAVVDVSQAIIAVRDTEKLFSVITNSITRHFDYYHVGIFLIDQQRRYAELVASNSEGGKRMLLRKHKLEIGRIGIVGNVAWTGIPRIALDVGQEATFFNNPDLPDTRSEMALPLIVNDEIIGVLDVQSTREAAFNEGDISVMSALANQIAVAIENVRLFERTNQALIAADKAYKEYVQKEWGEFANRSTIIGYKYADQVVSPINSDEEDTPSTVTVPILLRGEKLGEISIVTDAPNQIISSDALEIIKAAAERSGLALENARLLQDAQILVAKERKISFGSTRVSSALDIKSVLQAAIEEIEDAIGSSEITIQLEGNQ